MFSPPGTGVFGPARVWVPTQCISHDVGGTGREAGAGGPWPDAGLSARDRITLTLRRRLRVGDPSVRAP